MEKNILFYADKRFTVSQSGSISLPLGALFDGNYQPNYSGPIDQSNPYVITIENLPAAHTQTGAWIGWTTRYWSPVKFKIEAYDSYPYNPTYNSWVTVADVSNYHNGSYIVSLPQIASSKIRFTIYQGEGPNNSIGISELFLLHTEASVAYDGLMVKYDASGNVAIGTPNKNGDKLAVNGTIHSKQVTVDLNNWADYVFNKDYALIPLSDVKTYIDQNHHLPEIPSEKEITEKGLNLGEMNKLLMKKVEELTLYLIEKDKQINTQQQELNKQQMINTASESRTKKLEEQVELLIKTKK